MSFNKIIGYCAFPCFEEDSFFKTYEDIEEMHWIRIKTASTFLSNENIGPKVKSIDDESHTIEYERVTPLDNSEKSPRPNMTKEEIRQKICRLVEKLHALGYGHGDLHIGNIGFGNDNLYILDHDSVYRIEEGEVEWLGRWMREGHDWEGTFEEFVKNDYETWNTDWISIL